MIVHLFFRLLSEIICTLSSKRYLIIGGSDMGGTIEKFGHQ